MFSRKKNKEKDKEKTGDVERQNSSTVTKIVGNTITQRTVTQTQTSFSSSFASSVVTTENRLLNNVIDGTKRLSLFTPETPSRPRFNSLFDVDAQLSTPITLSPSTQKGYESPFSRKLVPYQSLDANPFNPRTELRPSSSSSMLSPQSNFSRNLPSSYSYRQPSTTVSTHSLPVTSTAIQNRDPIVPTYKTDGVKRGKVLVINNVKFLKEKQERKGAEIDEKNLIDLFKKIGFEVETSRDLKQSAMLDKIKKFKNQSSLKSVDMAFIIMMSHGSNEDPTGKIVYGGFTQIYGTDDKGLLIDDVLNLFSTENCPAMAGKPKIFIFQCCRGEGSETIHFDARPIQTSVKRHADMLVAFSTLPGFYSIRDTNKGSWYIQSICEVFKQHATDFDVESLLKIVDDQLSQKHPEYKQTSSYESRGFKRCFLNPKRS